MTNSVPMVNNKCIQSDIFFSEEDNIFPLIGVLLIVKSQGLKDITKFDLSRYIFLQ